MADDANLGDSDDGEAAKATPHVREAHDADDQQVLKANPSDEEAKLDIALDESFPTSDFDEEAERKHLAVRERAYTLWESEGRPEGRHDDHWSRAHTGDEDQ